MPGRLMTMSLPWRATVELATPRPLTRRSMMVTACCSCPVLAWVSGLQHDRDPAFEVEAQQRLWPVATVATEGDHRGADDEDQGPDEAASHGQGCWSGLSSGASSVAGLAWVDRGSARRLRWRDVGDEGDDGAEGRPGSEADGSAQHGEDHPGSYLDLGGVSIEGHQPAVDAAGGDDRRRRRTSWRAAVCCWRAAAVGAG